MLSAQAKRKSLKDYYLFGKAASTIDLRCRLPKIAGLAFVQDIVHSIGSISLHHSPIARTIPLTFPR